MEGLTELEQAVLAKLLDGAHPTLGALRAQAKLARPRHRERTGVGFWTDLDVPEHSPRTQPRDFLLNDVDAAIAGLSHGAGFVLHVRAGRLAQLEGFTYDEPWPDEIGAFELTYRKQPRELRIGAVSAQGPSTDPQVQ